MQWALSIKISLHMCFYFPPPLGLDCITGVPVLYHDPMSDPELRQMIM